MVVLLMVEILHLGCIIVANNEMNMDELRLLH